MSRNRPRDGRSDSTWLGILGTRCSAVSRSSPTARPQSWCACPERPTPIEQRRPTCRLIWSVIPQLLEKDPANRFPSAGSVVVALDTGRMPAFRTPEPWSRPARRRRPRRPSRRMPDIPRAHSSPGSRSRRRPPRSTAAGRHQRSSGSGRRSRRTCSSTACSWCSTSPLAWMCSGSR